MTSKLRLLNDAMGIEGLEGRSYLCREGREVSLLVFFTFSGDEEHLIILGGFLQLLEEGPLVS